MATLDDNSIDAIVCDPPYELNFMGRTWDNTGIAYDVTVWQQCLRVLKPGGHLVAFGGSRTYHRLAVAIEDAGFEIRDQIQWIYGSGFPKSLDVSKAMNKQAGATREVVGEKIGRDGAKRNPKLHVAEMAQTAYGHYETSSWAQPITAPSTDLAKQWQGYGTALKPAHEPAVLARKPLCGTVADNVKTWGVGGLNIDGTRVSGVPWHRNDNGIGDPGMWAGKGQQHYAEQHTAGRWPANVILDEDAAKALDMQSGHTKSNYGIRNNKKIMDMYLTGKKPIVTTGDYSDSGGASRFFYTAKASKAEREAGLYYEEWQVTGAMQGNVTGGRTAGDGRENPEIKPVQRANHHPTIKPLSLMRYLVRLVTPKGGKVLDPFMGSGSTGCASILEGFDFVGIDITPEYVAIAQKRIAHYAVESPLEGF
jgi:site-specific DNA-methyltransferase (adenine-specific)